ncbi:hypothetical protein FNV43_RR11528 [Rhamnella rubrinervis]|uniref:Jasmonate O-methyltransferase n=1 Tax=Rhamnella rubrinervis TaxID=2594499 RepID=A0A8K0H660_9ROSA|nr:hypothetical protein FNV43_RR11528 [Rhamnella rubrinervis]
MEVVRALHMNKGAGESSYAQNSKVQSKILSIAKPVIEEALVKTLGTKIPESMGIADLGCSSGPNALSVIWQIVDVIHAKCCTLGSSPAELRLFLNDLFSNDFNNIFASLPTFYNQIKDDTGLELGPCFVSGVPGSFYGRLFPRNSLHFIHSSSSLHWLSQVPGGLESDAKTALNKGKLYISKSSPQIVLEAYSLQFQKDFSMFLKCRSEELVSGGRMVLSFIGRSASDPTTDDSCYHWELLAQALMSMVSEGLVEEEKVDTFNAPYYAPCAEELKVEIEKEGSFIVDRLEAFEIDWDGDGGDVIHNSTFETQFRGQRVAKTIRAVVESLLEYHFGNDIPMDDLFRRYAQLVGDYLSMKKTKYINFVISLVRRDSY